MTGSTPWLRAVARMVGKRLSQNSAPRCRASSHMCGCPVSIIRRVIALATTSRGARSASSCTPCMKRLPSKSTRNAPSPRTASEISGCWPWESGPSHITVGWNCTNSRSRSVGAGAQRERHPVAGGDGGVRGLGEHLAEATAGQHHRPAVHRADTVALALAHHVQGQAGDAAVGIGEQVDGERVLDDLDAGLGRRPRRSAPAGSRRRWRRRRRARSGRGGGRPRGSATGRRPRCGRSCVPSAISSRTASGPSVTRTCTASGSQAPAPATSVSRSCWAGVSPGPSAAAIPP